MVSTLLHQILRKDLAAPGFALLDLGVVDSPALRRRMIALKEELSAARRLVFRTLGRFDQQETTRFHLDGGPPESILMLGYEPSRVGSRLFLADYLRCARNLNLDPETLLGSLMFRDDERLLAFVTELPQPEEGHSRILLINNSPWPNLGVLHKATILNPSETEQRIVNSALLATEGDDLDEQRQRDFVTTTSISQKVS